MEIKIDQPPAVPAPAEELPKLPKFVWMGLFTELDGTVQLPDGSFTCMGPGRGLMEIQQEWFDRMVKEGKVQ